MSLFASFSAFLTQINSRLKENSSFCKRKRSDYAYVYPFSHVRFYLGGNHASKACPSFLNNRHFIEKKRMKTLDKILLFLKQADNISLGHSEITLVAPDALNDAQVGYRIDEHGNSIITEQPGDWEEAWIVIGNDSLGDPIFIDSTNAHLPVFTAPHGDGEWEPIGIAHSLDLFKGILTELNELSIGRKSPAALEKNPIPEKDAERFLQKIEDKNPEAEMWWWELFLVNEEE